MARALSSPLTTISEALELASADLLRPMLALAAKAQRVAVDAARRRHDHEGKRAAAPPPRRKADLIAEIEGLLRGDSLRGLWGALNETQQLAVREALGTPDGFFDRHLFKLKYGRLPAGFGVAATPSATLLHFFIYAPRRGGLDPTIVPLELAGRLRDFVPPPPEVEVPAAEELPEGVPLTRRDMEQAAQHDLLAVLRLVDTGRIGVSTGTQRPGAAACQRLAEVLAGGDYFEWWASGAPEQVREIGPIRAFAWPCLVQAARLAELRGSKLALTKSGRAALRAPAAETLRAIWKRWLGSKLLDEFNRVDAIKGQTRGTGRRTMTAVPGRRSAIADALLQCPVGRWVSFDDFGQLMQVAGFDFVVNRNPWNLYLAEPRYGSLGYDGSHDWAIVEGRYALCLLFEYAATLGLIDVAYTEPHGARENYTHMWGSDDLLYLSRYDGLHSFRLNALGAYCLGIAEAYGARTPASRAALTLYPDLSIHADAPLSPDERTLLETYAAEEADGVWRLDRDRALAAIEDGHDPDEFRKFLAARDYQPLPETVDGFLQAAKRGARALRIRRTALLIDCADAEIATRLTTDKRTARLCLRAGERLLAVPTASEAAFRKAARAMGYGMPPR
ncbi:MAG: hypothetical protein OXH69_14610 [Acidobacteria bacterium]|nr:hypothetical protein [Acidobacteriota bacterium]